MSWITQTIDFYRGISAFKAPTAAPQVPLKMTEQRQIQSVQSVDYESQEQWLIDFEESSQAHDGETLTPKQHGDRLLRLTKARALRRLLERNSLQHDSAA